MGIESVRNNVSSYTTQSASEMDARSNMTRSTIESLTRREENTSGKERLQESSAEEQEHKNRVEEVAEHRANTNDKIRKIVDEINKQNHNSEAIFGIHEATNRVTIKIVDKESREVIKEYPPEETLDMIAKVWEIAGIMVDEKR